MNDQVTPRRRSIALGQPYLNNLVSVVSAPAMSLSARSGQIPGRSAPRDCTLTTCGH